MFYMACIVFMNTCFRLLDILAGRIESKVVTGDVLINGERQPKQFRLMSGFVVQVGCITFVIKPIILCNV